MDFLKSLFNEELDSEGEITIAGATFQRSRILSELEPESYKDAFDGWKDERVQRLLEKAGAILGQYDNGDRFERLKHAYKSGSVVPFVGAGLSIPSRYPGWTAFLYRLREESHVVEAELTTLISNGEYEEAAQLLHDDAPKLFNEALVNYFARDRDILGPIQYLPYLFNGTVFTTNFDNVLKRLYDQAECSFDIEMFGDDSEEFPKC